MTRSRVVVVGPTFPFKGGVAQHTTTLAHQLTAHGAEVQIESWSRMYPQRLYPGRLEVDRPEVSEFEPVHRRLSWSRPDGWIAVGRAIRDCDVAVFAHVIPFQAVPYRFVIGAMGRRRRRRARVAIICHNVLPHERHFGDTRIVKGFLRSADRVLVHSAAQADVARSLLAGDRLHEVLRLAPLPPFFPSGFVRGDESRSEHRRLLFFGIIRPYKGLEVLLRALASTPEDICLRVAGEMWGGQDPWTRLCSELNIAHRVEFVPQYVPSDEVPRLFEDVDGLVLPYLEATGSQAVWTSFHFGVPVIATRTGDFANEVSDGVDGLLVDPGDVSGLATAIREFYRHGRASRLREAVRPVDEDRLWGAYLDQLLDGLV